MKVAFHSSGRAGAAFTIQGTIRVVNGESKPGLRTVKPIKVNSIFEAAHENEGSIPTVNNVIVYGP